MKQPIIKLLGNALGVVDPIVGATYSWQYSKTPNGYDGWLNFGNTYEIPTHLQVDGYEFWCYQKEGLDKSTDSERVVYGGTQPPVIPPIIPDGNTVEVDKAVLEAIKSHSEHIIFLINEELK